MPLPLGEAFWGLTLLLNACNGVCVNSQITGISAQEISILLNGKALACNETRLLSGSLSACLDQRTSKGESIRYWSVCDSSALFLRSARHFC